MAKMAKHLEGRGRSNMLLRLPAKSNSCCLRRAMLQHVDGKAGKRSTRNCLSGSCPSFVAVWSVSPDEKSGSTLSSLSVLARVAS